MTKSPEQFGWGKDDPSVDRVGVGKFTKEGIEVTGQMSARKLAESQIREYDAKQKKNKERGYGVDESGLFGAEGKDLCFGYEYPEPSVAEFLKIVQKEFPNTPLDELTIIANSDETFHVHKKGNPE